MFSWGAPPYEWNGTKWVLRKTSVAGYQDIILSIVTVKEDTDSTAKGISVESFTKIRKIKPEGTLFKKWKKNLSFQPYVLH